MGVDRVLADAQATRGLSVGESGGDEVQHPGVIPVRDSKRAEGPALVIPASAWTPFVESVKAP
ncbi:DUF397 domain-containing protein [Streptomyces sp. NBC_00846]|uniref:DUF397 domain-containing protein n=1 Tax=Streptomyces sp. NBC_00846 TaxID=2975849 RepID=UPI00386DED00|nr:DUF397 domain-containing protein [Streptomyces sp. NBC_00846]